MLYLAKVPKNHSFDFMCGLSYFFIRKKVSKMLVKNVRQFFDRPSPPRRTFDRIQILVYTKIFSQKNYFYNVFFLFSKLAKWE